MTVGGSVDAGRLPITTRIIWRRSVGSQTAWINHLSGHSARSAHSAQGHIRGQIGSPTGDVRGQIGSRCSRSHCASRSQLDPRLGHDLVPPAVSHGGPIYRTAGDLL